MLLLHDIFHCHFVVLKLQSFYLSFSSFKICLFFKQYRELLQIQTTMLKCYDVA